MHRLPVKQAMYYLNQDGLTTQDRKEKSAKRAMDVKEDGR
jgi:hypothetical protein